MSRGAQLATLSPNERAWQDQVIELARLYGWRVAHFRPAKTEQGWRTPVQADGAGFPDLVLVRPPRVIFAELKSATGGIRAEQRVWLDQLLDCGGVETYIWRPNDFDQVARILGADR